MQFQLPLAIRGKLSPGVCEAIYRLLRLVRWISLKDVDASKIEKMKQESYVVLSLLQMQFPTSFFDSQQHLIVHLVEEIALAGPPFYRWMFFVERYLKVLKNFVRQKARPEGSIIEGYLLQETMENCQDFIQDAGTYAPRAWRGDYNTLQKGMGLTFCFSPHLYNVSYMA